MKQNGFKLIWKALSQEQRRELIARMQVHENSMWRWVAQPSKRPYHQLTKLSEALTDITGETVTVEYLVTEHAVIQTSNTAAA